MNTNDAENCANTEHARGIKDVFKFCFALLFSTGVTILLCIFGVVFPPTTGIKGFYWFFREVHDYFHELGFWAVMYYIANSLLIFGLARRWWQAKEYRTRKYWLFFLTTCFFWSPVGALFFLFIGFCYFRILS